MGAGRGAGGTEPGRAPQNHGSELPCAVKTGTCSPGPRSLRNCTGCRPPPPGSLLKEKGTSFAARKNAQETDSRL